MLNLQVLGNKFQSRLLQIIDTRFVFMFVLPQLIKGFYVYYNAYHVSIPFCLFFNSQLPDFLGGSCSCPNDGGCLRSNKGPWNDPDILKVWYYWDYLPRLYEITFKNYCSIAQLISPCSIYSCCILGKQ